MRILYHHRTLADGAEGIHIAAMVDAFRTLGHEVHVAGATHRETGAGGPGKSEERRDLVQAIRSRLPETAVQAASWAIDVPERWKLSSTIARLQPDFVYSRHARYSTAAIRAARRSGTPLVLEVNTVYSSRAYRAFEPLMLRPIAEAMERRAFREASVVVAVSTPMAEAVKALSGREPVVMPNGADPQQFDPALGGGAELRREYGVQAPVVIGWSGILRTWHGLDLLLQALDRVAGADLLLIGDGPERAAVEQHVATLKLQDRVVITGRVAHDRVPAHLAAVDIAVVAHDRTGVASPMKLLEYMAMGRAIVAPRAANIADLIDDGINGVLFTPGDVGSLTEALQRLLGDPELRRRLGERARQKVEQQLNWRSNAEAVVTLARRATTAS